MRVQARSQATAGNGPVGRQHHPHRAHHLAHLWIVKRAGHEDGANPAAVSQALRSRSGTSRVSLNCRIMLRLGWARPEFPGN